MIKMLMRALAKRQEAEELEKAEKVSRLKLVEATYTKEIRDTIASMTKKPCPFNNWDKCNTECVHFYRGKVWPMDFAGKKYMASKMPKCKLWKD